MKNNFFSIFLFFLYFGELNTHSQTDTIISNSDVVSSDWKESGLIMGVNFSKYLYGEIGYYRGYVYEMGGLPILSKFMNYSCEFSYFDKLILAPKVQARINLYFFNGSLSAIFYSDMNDSYALKLRPEIGIGWSNLDIHYGYNIGIIKNNFERANTHVFSFRYFLSLKKKYIGEYNNEGIEVKK